MEESIEVTLTIGSITVALLEQHKPIDREVLYEKLDPRPTNGIFNQAITNLIGDGLILDLSGSIILTEKGRCMGNLFCDKIDVADIVGENEIYITPEEFDKIDDASSDVPG